MTQKQRKFKAVAAGIGVRLVGGGLIFLGDGHTSVWSKIVVAVGVILSIAGIGILRYLLLSPLLSSLGARRSAMVRRPRK